MNSDHATCGGSAWSTQAVNDSMYACGVGKGQTRYLCLRRCPQVAVEHPLRSAFAMDATLRARSEGKEICLPIAAPLGGPPLWLLRRPFR
jgi:hypothetical protein